MAATRQEKTPDGLLVLDKPRGMSSRAALDRALSWFPRGTRMGHTGTLDPLASGILVLCLGSATRLAEYVQRMAKTYRTTFRLGARSSTDDAEGILTPAEGVTPPERKLVADAFAEFVGKVAQVPPAFSAAKVTGRRAYDLARAGRAVTLTARTVEIYGIELLAFDYPFLEIEVRCGKGTYIRSLARDLGERLGCGAFVQELRRVRVGPFGLDGAVHPDEEPPRARGQLLPLEAAVAELPRRVVDDEDARRLARGQAIAPGPEGACAEEVAVFDAAGHLVAVARMDPQQERWLPEKVFSQP